MNNNSSYKSFFNLIIIMVVIVMTVMAFSGCNSNNPSDKPADGTSSATNSPDATAAPTFTPVPTGNVTSLTPKMEELVNMTATDYIPDEKIKTTVDVASLGVKLNDKDAALENTRLINTAIYNAEEYTKFVFPEGSIYIDASDGYGIIVASKSNIILKGNNTKIINASYEGHKYETDAEYFYADVFAVTLSNNVKIDGFTVDYLNHTSADGEVIKIEDGYTYIEVFDEFIKGDKNPLKGGEHVLCLSCVDTGKIPDTEYWMTDRVVLLEATEEDNVFRLEGIYGEEGSIVSARFTLGFYSCHEIMLLNANGVNIQNYTSHSSPAAVVFAGYRCGNICITNMTVKVADGSEAIFASNADCMHMKSVTGTLYIADCNFEGIGDDALNITQQMAIVTETEGTTLNIVCRETNAKMDDYWLSVGDEFEFFDPATHESLGKAKVVKFDDTKVTFDSLPNGVTKGVYAQNLALCPDTVVKNVTVKNGRARGFLIQTKNAALLDNNISNLRLSGILCAPDFDYWSELGFTENLVIKGNTIKNVCREEAYKEMGAIAILACHDMPQDTIVPKKGHGSVYIEENTFTGVKVALNYPG